MGEIEIKYDGQTSKYRDDTVFQLVSSDFLTLSECDRKVNNEHLQEVIQEFIYLMRENELFDLMFQRIMYGGSYYKGTKYGKPEEFDLNFVIYLPIDYDEIQIDTNHINYGSVKIKIKRKPSDPNWIKYSDVLDKFLTADNYLDQNKFRSWMESVFTSAFSKLEIGGNGYEMHVDCGETCTIRHKKSGPAFTMMIDTERTEMDVDIVPCLEFNLIQLKNGFKPLDKKIRKSWMVVAKPLPNDTPNRNILWRPCFYQHEKDILEGQIKPVIRMMKKFRDTMKWESIASYYIETIFFHELAKNKRDLDNFLRASKTWQFMYAMKKLKTALERQKLPYFWHPKYNLFSRIKKDELQVYAAQMRKIITVIDANIEKDRFVLADIVLEKHEARALRMEENCLAEHGTYALRMQENQSVKSRKPTYCRRSNRRETNDDLWKFVFIVIVTFLMYVFSTPPDDDSA